MNCPELQMLSCFFAFVQIGGMFASSERGGLESENKELGGGRVWILFSHVARILLSCCDSIIVCSLRG